MGSSLAQPTALMLVLVPLLMCSLFHPSFAAPEAGCHHLLQEFKHFTATALQPGPFTGSSSPAFFLHIPRTGGASLQCLLNMATPQSRRCPSAYDVLPAAEELHGCAILSSHDDLSALQQLPPGTAVFTVLRDPVKRALSTYEFAVQQAARNLFPSAGFARPTEEQAAPGALPFAFTDNVWPWNHLVPFMAADIKPKITALKAVPLEAPGVWTEQRNPDGTRFHYNKFLNASKASLTDEEQQRLVPELSAYDNQVAMSLQDFIRHPVALELLHNGQLLQVLGLTNSSRWERAAELRACMAQHEDIAEELLQMGMQQLERFAHVGITDRRNDTTEALASALGMDFEKEAYSVKQATMADVLDQSQISSMLDNETKQHLLQALTNKTRDHTVGVPLGVGHQLCAKQALQTAAKYKSRNLRALRLSDWRQLYFDGDDRADLPLELLQEIRALNSLDERLYQRGLELLEQQRQQLQAAGTLQHLPDASAPTTTMTPGGADANNDTRPAFPMHLFADQIKDALAQKKKRFELRMPQQGEGAGTSEL